MQDFYNKQYLSKSCWLKPPSLLQMFTQLGPFSLVSINTSCSFCCPWSDHHSLDADPNVLLGACRSEVVCMQDDVARPRFAGERYVTKPVRPLKTPQDTLKHPLESNYGLPILVNIMIISQTTGRVETTAGIPQNAVKTKDAMKDI